RRAAARLMVGRRVLDAFCYTGGFGPHAGEGGGGSGVRIDMLGPGVGGGRGDARPNGPAPPEYSKGGRCAPLARPGAGRGRVGGVRPGPPRCAGTRGAVEEALRGYRRLQTLGLRLLESDGVLVTCCCSGAITLPMLEELLAQLAAEEKRDVQILDRRGQAAD